MDKDRPDEARKPETAQDGKPKTGQKIDEQAQEDAAEERKEGGYQ